MTQQWSLGNTYESSHGNVRYDSIGDGPPLILVHGTPWSSYVWRNIASTLRDTHTVYVYDLVGYGQSEKFDGQDVSLGIQNDVLVELIEHWNLETPVIAWHDFGGATVLRTRLLNDIQFHRIALLDAVSIRPWGSSFYQHVRQYEAAFAGLPDYIHRAVVSAYLEGAFVRDMSDDELRPFIEPWSGPVGRPAFYRQISQNGPEYTDEVEDRFDKIDEPVLIVWGEQDEWLPFDIGRQLYERLPTSDFRTIPNAGHLVQEDAPETVSRHLLDFFN